MVDQFLAGKLNGATAEDRQQFESQVEQQQARIEAPRSEGADTRFGCLIGASDGSGSEPSLARER